MHHFAYADTITSRWPVLSAAQDEVAARAWMMPADSLPIPTAMNVSVPSISSSAAHDYAVQKADHADWMSLRGLQEFINNVRAHANMLQARGLIAARSYMDSLLPFRPGMPAVTAGFQAGSRRLPHHWYQ